MMEHRSRAASRVVLGVLVALALAATSGWSQPYTDGTNQGYDPMRQITTQQLHPNVLLVFDRSGSLASPIVFNSSRDSRGSSGSSYWSRWAFRYSSSINGTPLVAADYARSFSGQYPTTGAGHGYWLRAKTNPPWSGLVRRKRQTTCSDCDQYVYVVGNPSWNNGNTITITEFDDSSWDGSYVLCSSLQWDSRFSQWRFKVKRPGDAACATFSVTADDNVVIERAGEDYYSLWYFVPPSRIAILKNALGNSIRLYEPTVEQFGVDSYGKPYYRFGPTAGPVGGAYYNWESKTWVGWSPTTSEPVGDADFTRMESPRDLLGRSANSVNWGLLIYYENSTSELVRVNPDDTAQAGVVTQLETYMSTASAGGLNPDGRTPTSRGLNAAKASLGFTYTADSKRDCGRLFATILVTDGQSNNCNPSDNEWGNSCTNYLSSSRLYPPGRTDELFLRASDSSSDCTSPSASPTAVQSFAIGVSEDVSRCELNLAAYFGRTDASAGVDMVKWQGSSRLPQNTTGTTSLGNFAAAPDNTEIEDYAFFASNADALTDAFESIIAGLGQGDYTTSAPSVTSSPISSGGLIGFVSSATYPRWGGHLYAYDLGANCADTRKWDCTQPCGWVDATDPGLKSNCLWDAGEVLSLGALNPDGTRKARNNGVTRRLYTWDPMSGNALVPIAGDETSVESLNVLCGDCGITAVVADFMAGNDGAGSPRSWQLGSIVNSTQAVVGPAQVWKQNTLESHSAFESDYAERHSIVWVGSSDGFIHGIDAHDGAELVALIPPEQLGKQPDLYENYLANPSDSPVGQAKLANRHVYGVANSPRFGDVWFTTSDEYRTMLYVSQGPGGTGVVAIDVTHPFPGRDYNIDYDSQDTDEKADPNYSDSAPVSVVWSKNRQGADFGSLGNTWSVPALGATAQDVWQLIMGGGFDERFSSTSTPSVFRLDATTGARNDLESVSIGSGAIIRNQTFADSVFWQTTAGSFQQDNLVDQGVQVDLNGRVWALQGNNFPASILKDMTSAQPLYYPPAVAAYPAGASPTYRLYAFGSGTFYERSPAITGSSSTFVPKIHIMVGEGTRTPEVQSLSLSAIRKPGGLTFLSRKTQLTAPPIIFVAKQGSGSDPFALFLVYDPDAGVCVGNSYIIKVDFDPRALTSLAAPTVYLAGAGAASGFALAGEKVVVSRSYVGENGRASLQEVPNLRIPQGGLGGNVSWWLELQ